MTRRAFTMDMIVIDDHVRGMPLPDETLFAAYDGSTKRHFHNTQLPGPLVRGAQLCGDCVVESER